ncbi:unnamed protein product [Linum trigynum]|uniref:Uncharacterized protein n=1 Tax=Linum trigynum TaxID=586398 RepID=A0AAV2FSD1_9ROSI
MAWMKTTVRLPAISRLGLNPLPSRISAASCLVRSCSFADSRLRLPVELSDHRPSSSAGIPSEADGDGSALVDAVGAAVLVAEELLAHYFGPLHILTLMPCLSLL